MNFLDIKTDFAFKKVFGSKDSKDILISFLNSVIDFKHHQKIASIKIVDPYNIPMLKGMKDTYVDVKAVLDNGSHVIIEMQVLNTEGLEKRILYNAAKNYSSQLKKGEEYSLLNPVIALTITDFNLFQENHELITHFKLIEKQQLVEYGDDIELIFIELPKFTKSEQELKSIQDKWIFFIKNAGSLEYIPKNMSLELTKAYTIANEANFSEEELELQHRKKDWIYMQKSSLSLAKKTGHQEGHKEGHEKGLKDGKIEIAINLHKVGIAIEIISQSTGLSIEEIEQIIKLYP
ncbi:MAG: Rpn family recombination-promoting nuclease/putative transposase [Methylococcales bacterium]|jgi:predicted transposase/invertase (TIGR01784 family)|nr:Rpn family recombination-promoting nuclease/putative transposase [Methylococcales bacterium]